ncbi:hypothetical protein P22_1097 [Propionispora sp. 2/2-37]|uniref:prenylated flavin chaperone LpdD n=1 Tax=Propionispora sp. 2/2-37 TaxID=1677858 RepID=UPI0006BB855B|nr:hypothetical protein [Propionispora sp. 2/2-37]CUH95028.1 hypothetical protein P22_1097 [Propionispora sp. 2/2-37]
MKTIELTKGSGRTKVTLICDRMGTGLVVRIFNEAEHIGAVAVGEYDHAHERASCSLINRLGHKDDVIALPVAHRIARKTKNPVCVIAGVHLDNITPSEISVLTYGYEKLVDEMLGMLEAGVI